MSHSVRHGRAGRAAGFLTLLVLLRPATVSAQEKPPSAPPAHPQTGELPPFSHFATLPDDPAAARKLRAAYDYIRTEEWLDAVQLLQGRLVEREDVFVPALRRREDGKPVVVRVSARAEARRILNDLPPKAMAVYELTFGPDARHLLAEAKKTCNAELLAQVVRRYEYTQAGLEALQLLGLHHLDRGHRTLAARCFRQVLERAGSDRLPPLVLFQAALAFRRAGDRARHDRAWKALTVAAPDGLTSGGKQIGLAELRKRIDAFDRPSEPMPSNWLTFRGDAGRSNRAAGGPPRLEKRWQQPTTQDGEARAWLERAVQQQHTNARPVLPGAFPLVAGDRVVFRSQRGIVATDLETGELLWEAPSAWGLDTLASDVHSSPHVSAWVEAHLRSHPQVLFENSVLGTLSADRTHVFAVEDVPVLPVPNNYAGFRGRGGLGLQLAFAPELTDAVYHNRLLAIDLETGKVVWERGGRSTTLRAKDDLADTYFLGPPLSLEGRLYALVEHDQEVTLLCLDGASGEVQWRQKLATPKNKLLLDGPRRMCVAPLTGAEGILVCPTNAGALVAFDLPTRTLLWAHAYRAEPPPPPPEDEEFHRRARWRRRSMPAEPPPSLDTNWSAATPVIQGDRVIFTAPDEPAVQCVNLHSGALLWRADRADADLYLAGVHAGRVLLVGAKHCRALRLEDGKEAWKVETGEPAGHGVFSGGSYYLPLRAAEGGKPAIHALDVAKGAIVGRMPSSGEVPGNLLFCRGSVLSQTVDAVRCYPQTKAKRDR
jgi:outer membrane protein assembly factor BamB